jgi:hypothetical protein
MHEIVCRSTEGLLRTGIWTAGCRKARERAICDRRMHMFSQYPRESRSKARTGTGAHNHGAAGATDPADSPVCIGGLWFCFQKENKGKKTLSTKYCGESVFHFSPFRRFGSSRYRRATLAIELGGRSNLPKWTFPISLRFVPSLFCYASAFHFFFTLRRLGANASD